MGNDTTIHTATPDDLADCETILRLLPDWFGIEEATAQYVADIQHMNTLVARDHASVIGFLTLNPHNQVTAEVHVMAVHPDWRRRGVGRKLMACAETWSRSQGYRILEVKTLGPSTESEHYERTRAFYRACGFLPLEERHDIWPGNSCLIMIKPL